MNYKQWENEVVAKNGKVVEGLNVDPENPEKEYLVAGWDSEADNAKNNRTGVLRHMRRDGWEVKREHRETKDGKLLLIVAKRLRGVEKLTEAKKPTGEKKERKAKKPSSLSVLAVPEIRSLADFRLEVKDSYTVEDMQDALQVIEVQIQRWMAVQGILKEELVIKEEAEKASPLPGEETAEETVTAEPTQEESTETIGAEAV